MDKQTHKVVILGLDGATWDLLNILIRKNKLPFLKYLMSESSYGILSSTHPSQTAVAWTSFQTASNPGRTGVYDFFKLQNKKILNDFVDLDDVQVPSFWDYAVRVGKIPCIVGLPVSYPFPKNDGIYVAGLLTPPNVPFATPPKIYKALKKIDYKVEVAFENFLDIPSDFDRKKVYEEIIGITRKRIEAIKLLSEEQWAIFFLLFKELDIVQHFFWGKSELDDYWQFLDAQLESVYEYLSKKFGNRLIFCLMSDHGFHKTPTYQVGLYKWLQEEGFLPVEQKTIKARVLSLGQKFYWWLQHRNIELTKIEFFKKMSIRAVKDEKAENLFDVFFYGISINKSLIKPGDSYTVLKDKLIKRLRAV